MTIDEFIALTQKVISENGIADYLPTLVLETRKTVRICVLEDDPPPDVAPEEFARTWASQVAKRRQNYLLAFKVDDEHFKVVSRNAGNADERLVAVDVY